MRRIVISVDREIALARRIAAFFGAVAPSRPGAPNDDPTSARPDRAAAFAYLDELDAHFGPAAQLSADALDAPIDVLLFDGNAAIALARGDAVARAFLRIALERRVDVAIAASALADPRAVAIAHRVARAIEIDDRIGCDAARLVTGARLALPLDALTVACAPSDRRVKILTADPAGLGALVRASGRPDLVVVAVGRRLDRG